MAKDAGQMHGLHQLMRTWLLSEDPYGLNNRIEPTMGTAAPAGPAAAATASDPRASEAGTAAVDKEMDKVNTEQWRSKMEGRKAQRAQAGEQGRAAVGDAVSPANVRKMIAAQSQQPQWASPEESAGWASAVGQSAVEGARPAPQGPAGWYPPSDNANTNRPSSVVRGPSAGQLTPEQEAQVQEMMRRSMAEAPEGDEFVHDTTAIDEFLAGQNRPMMPPRAPANPATVTDLSSHPGYATSPQRASYWGPKAVESELDKEPE
jgi:hypothetical protein